MHTIYFSTYHVLLFIGIFQGLLLSYILFFNKKFRRTSSIAFAIGMLALTFACLNEILHDLDIYNSYGIVYLPLSHLSLVAIGYYYFVVYLIQPNYTFKRKDYWILGLFGALFLVKIMVLCIDLSSNSNNSQHILKQLIYIPLMNYAPVFYFLFLSLLGLKRLNHCLLYTSPSPRDKRQSRMPSSA